MPVMKKAVKKNFTVVHNTFINDQSVDWDGKGMLLFMLSKPDKWKFSIKWLAAQTKSGEHKVSSILKNLRETGYLKMQRERSETGNFTEMVYYYSDEPIFLTSEENVNEENSVDTQFEPYCENRNMEIDSAEKVSENENQPHCGFPDVDNSDVDNPNVNIHPHNKYYNNKYYNNKYCNNQSINLSNTVTKKNDRLIDRFAERKMFEEQIKDNIEYDWIVDRYKANDLNVYGNKELLDNTIEIMLDCMCSKGDIKVGKQFFSADIVKSRFMKIDSEHIIHLFERLENYADNIINVRAYMITALYDVSTTRQIAEDSQVRAILR